MVPLTAGKLQSVQLQAKPKSFGNNTVEITIGFKICSPFKEQIKATRRNSEI